MTKLVKKTGFNLPLFWWKAGGCAALFTASLFLMPLPAQADNWQEVWPDAYYLNADTAFVDLESGFIFVETAAWDSAESEYFYSYMAVDCDRWESYAVAIIQNGRYLYKNTWRTDPRLAAGPLGGTSYMSMTATKICARRYNLPSDYPWNRF